MIQALATIPAGAFSFHFGCCRFFRKIVTGFHIPSGG
jgi:hypothetical protein